MRIVSVSLPEDLLQDVDHAITAKKGKGRSEVVRTALRQYLQTDQPMTGHMHGSITITYPHGKEARLSEVRHAFYDVVLSLMHTHCEEETCMDVLLVGGDARRVQTLFETLRRMREVDKAFLARAA
jgi:CopG family nickel-responsive transcriptional regulator